MKTFQFILPNPAFMHHGDDAVANCAVYSAVAQCESSCDTRLDAAAGGQLQQVALTAQRCHAAAVTVQRPPAESAGGTWSAHRRRAGKYRRKHDDHNQQV